MTVVTNLFIWFFLYSVVGWIYETTLCSLVQKQFVNRGFLNGPYCPIYGCGALLDILVLGQLENPVLLFFAAMLITSILEYLTSLGMELLFHARWWDYSDKKFNLHGRIYLVGAIAFGTFSLVLVKVVHPVVVVYTNLVPAHILTAVVIIIFAALLIDSIITIAKFSKFDEFLRITSEALDSSRLSAKAICEQIEASYRLHVQKTNSQIRRMILSFPQMKSTTHNESLKKLRELLQSNKNA